MRRVARAVNIADLKKIARSKVPRLVFDFVEGGVEDELGLATNEAGFSRIRLLPRYCVDTSAASQKKSVFGREYELPFGICPTGLNSLYRLGADLDLAKSARKVGIPFTLSGASNVALEVAAKVAGENLWFQLYHSRNREIGENMVRRAVEAGVTTLFLTVDVPVSGRRERNLRNGFTRPFRPRPRDVLDAVRRPSWLWNYLRNGGMPVIGTWQAYAPPGASAAEVADLFARETPDCSQSWEDVERLRNLWPHNFVLKGIMSPDDAVRAKSIGVNGVVVSNHGGRQLDRAPASIEMLPAIRAAVGPEMTLLLDSGVRRGSDIVSALCSGADFVLVGRATLYGAMAGGEEGVRKAISILREEIKMVLGQIGCTDVRQLGPRFLAREAMNDRYPAAAP